MAEKRFTDTGLNKQPWFRKLKPKMKCAIRFVFDECDKAGVWVIDMETLSYFVGEEVTLNELFEKVNSDKQNRIEKFGSDKIFIPGFVAFQYGELSEDCRPHKQIIALLKKYKLWDRVCNRVSDTLQEKTGQDKDKDKDMDKDFGKSENLLPKMFVVFKKAKPTYPDDQQKDFHALKSISAFICKQSGISYQPQEPDVGDKVMEAWEVIVNHLQEDSFYGNKSLSSISNNIQSIVQEIKNGKSGNHKTSGKQSAKATSAGLEQKFNEFYRKREPSANTG